MLSTPALVDSTDLTHLIGLGGPAEMLDVDDCMAVECGGSAEPRIAGISCTRDPVGFPLGSGGDSGGF